MIIEKDRSVQLSLRGGYRETCRYVLKGHCPAGVSLWDAKLQNAGF